MCQHSSGGGGTKTLLLWDIFSKTETDCTINPDAKKLINTGLFFCLDLLGLKLNETLCISILISQNLLPPERASLVSCLSETWKRGMISSLKKNQLTDMSQGSPNDQYQGRSRAYFNGLVSAKINLIEFRSLLYSALLHFVHISSTVRAGKTPVKQISLTMAQI